MKKRPSVKEINELLSRLAPPSLAEEGDPIGLQVGSLQEEVRGILIALDATEAGLREAARQDCNLLITHHPLLFKALRRLDDASPASRCARLATRMAINVLSFHTNLDSTVNGLNDQLAKKIGLKALRPLQISRDPRHPKAGLGRVGRLSRPTSLGAFAARLGLHLQLDHLRYVGNPEHPVREVAVMTGSGGRYFTAAKDAGADVLVTGDVKYHDALDALAEKIALVDIGHFAGEIGMVAWLTAWLKKALRRKNWKVKILPSHSGAEPFRLWKK
ncbi:MAG TPA: Nif3-like dinuclear metal center hexameric protein [Deltaproteobacteria bacterium]|nr:Nif3-like dinuclear metal center hexameric protein [Deltaproteobacteria bacterium]